MRSAVRLLSSRWLFPAVLVVAGLSALAPPIWRTARDAIWVETNGRPLSVPSKIDCPDCGRYQHWRPGGAYRCGYCEWLQHRATDWLEEAETDSRHLAGPGQ